MYDIESCLFFITNKASKKIAETFNKRLATLSITYVQWNALYYLGQTRMINQKELTDMMNIKSSTVVRLIDRMERDGLLKRVKNSEDRRLVYLELTDKGKTLRETLLPEVEKFRCDISRDINKEDLESFNRVLAQMLANLGS